MSVDGWCLRLWLDNCPWLSCDLLSFSVFAVVDVGARTTLFDRLRLDSFKRAGALETFGMGENQFAVWISGLAAEGLTPSGA